MALFNDAASLLFTVKANTDDARSDFKKFRNEVKETTDAAGHGAAPLEKLANMAGLTGTQFASIAGPASIAAAAITGVVAAAAAGISVLFDLAKQTAAYGDELHDTAQKTNVSTDAIQAWNFAAEQSGSNAEKVNVSLAKFSTLLGQAAEGNEKAQKTLAQYNITATDTDEALQQAVKSIAAMTDANKQNAAAAALFKDRGGDVINMIREMGGDLPGTIQKLREMGLLMSRENVEAAAAFNDKMDLLEKQLAATGRTIGAEVIPVFMQMATDISNWLAKNPGEIEFWGKIFKATLNGIVSTIKLAAISIEQIVDAISTLVQTVALFQNLGFGSAAGIAAMLDTFSQRSRDRAQRTAALFDPASYVSGAPAPTGTSGGGPNSRQDAEAKEEAEKARKERQRAFQQELQDRDANIRLRLQTEREGFDAAQQDLEKNYIERNITEKSFLENSIENIKAYRNQVMALIREGYLNDLKQATTDLQKENAKLTGNKALQALNTEIKRENADITSLVKKTNKELSADAEKERKAALKHWNDSVKAMQDMYDVQAEGIDAEQKAHEDAKKFWNERRKAQIDQAKLEDDADAARAKRDRADLEARLRQSSGGTFLGSIVDGMVAGAKAVNSMQGVLQTFGDMAVGVFNNVADAVGNMVANFVLTGSAGTSFRKFAAEILASIAQQAATLAIMCLAYAALATTAIGALLLGGTPAQFLIAAAMFGAVAAGTALAGRLVAGNAFKKENTGAFGTSGSSSQSGNPDQDEDRVALSRSANTTFDSGRRSENRGHSNLGAEADRIMSAVADRMHQAAENMERAASRFSGIKPGEMLIAGMSQKPGAVTRQVAKEFRTNPSLGTEIRRTGMF